MAKHIKLQPHLLPNMMGKEASSLIAHIFLPGGLSSSIHYNSTNEICVLGKICHWQILMASNLPPHPPPPSQSLCCCTSTLISHLGIIIMIQRFPTSAGYLVPATVCSEPLLSEAPQWKWNCLSLYNPEIGPSVKPAEREKNGRAVQHWHKKIWPARKALQKRCICEQKEME